MIISWCSFIRRSLGREAATWKSLSKLSSLGRPFNKHAEPTSVIDPKLVISRKNVNAAPRERNVVDRRDVVGCAGGTSWKIWIGRRKNGGGWSLLNFKGAGDIQMRTCAVVSLPFHGIRRHTHREKKGRLRELQPNKTDRGGRWEGASRWRLVHISPPLSYTHTHTHVLCGCVCGGQKNEGQQNQ